jgi:hypothetical protein
MPRYQAPCKKKLLRNMGDLKQIDTYYRPQQPVENKENIGDRSPISSKRKAAGKIPFLLSTAFSL